LNNKQTGDVGEHYVLYCLIREGFIANLAPRVNTKTVDVLCSTPEGLASTIQVKTQNTSRSETWRLSEAHGHTCIPSLFFALVKLREVEPHDVFIVPSRVIVRAVISSSRAYEKIPLLRGKNKGKLPEENRRPDAERRIFESFPESSYGQVPGCPPGWLEPYRECWDLLRGTPEVANK
jgi:hypothetical protein